MSPIHLIDEIGHVQGSTVCRLHSPFKSSGNGVVNLLFLYVVTPYNLACPNRRCGLISRGAFWPVAMCHGCSWVPERLKKKKKTPWVHWHILSHTRDLTGETDQPPVVCRALSSGGMMEWWAPSRLKLAAFRKVTQPVTLRMRLRGPEVF
jgi:hypothetical protein